MNENWDDENYIAQTIKPPPRMSQRPTIKIPQLPVEKVNITKRKNWDVLTSISFGLLLILAIILYCYINHPFKKSEDKVKTIIIYSAQPVLITTPITLSPLISSSNPPIETVSKQTVKPIPKIKSNKPNVELINPYGI